MENLADRIKLLRKKFGVTQEQLADVLGCSDGKVKAWEQGNTKNIKPKDSLKLAKHFKVSKEWLEDGVGEMIRSESDLLLDDITQTAALLDNSISIPFYKDIQASAGHGCENGDCTPTNITISKDMLPTLSDSIEAIRVTGNSMQPTINDEDVIFIDKNSTDVIDGKIYVVYLCEEVYVKRIFKQHKTKEILLKSDNDIYPDIMADCEDFRIIGKVIADMQIKKL